MKLFLENEERRNYTQASVLSKPELWLLHPDKLINLKLIRLKRNVERSYLKMWTIIILAGCAWGLSFLIWKAVPGVIQTRMLLTTNFVYAKSFHACFAHTRDTFITSIFTHCFVIKPLTHPYSSHLSDSLTSRDWEFYCDKHIQWKSVCFA